MDHATEEEEFRRAREEELYNQIYSGKTGTKETVDYNYTLSDLKTAQKQQYKQEEVLCAQFLETNPTVSADALSRENR